MRGNAVKLRCGRGDGIQAAHPLAHSMQPRPWPPGGGRPENNAQCTDADVDRICMILCCEAKLTDAVITY